MVRLTRDGNGGYKTADGRWTVTPITMGAGVTGWAGGRGWSNGRREWLLADTTNQAQLSAMGPRHQRIVQALWEARDVIAAYTSQES